VRLTDRARDLLMGGLRPPGLNPKETLLLVTLARAGDMSLEKLAEQTGVKDAARWIESCVENGWAQLEDAVVRGRVAEKLRLGIRARDGIRISSHGSPVRSGSCTGSCKRREKC